MKLADLPSALIRQALADLRICEASDEYEVDMEVWHRPSRDAVCHVCLAGAVMAQTLAENPKVHTHPFAYPGSVEDRMFALDAFRDGRIKAGVRHMLGYEINEEPDFKIYTDYDRDPESFHLSMEEVACWLEERGL